MSWQSAVASLISRRKSRAACALHEHGSQKAKDDNRSDRVTRPFEGVRILDFTQVLAGPYASYQLALLGADVIKVERREGEEMRHGSSLSKEWAERGLAPGWQAINGNKR